MEWNGLDLGFFDTWHGEPGDDSSDGLLMIRIGMGDTSGASVCIYLHSRHEISRKSMHGLVSSRARFSLP
jgi:hypothetical protein